MTDLIYHVGPEDIELDHLRLALHPKCKLVLTEVARQRILAGRAYLDAKVEGSEKLFYGINTGFGSLCNVVIDANDLEQLQYNLVRSHAAGVGETIPIALIRIILFLKIRSLAYGHSAVNIEIVERLIDFYNHDIYPVIYEMGSLGASGDLAPLAHLSLPLIGEGYVWQNGHKMAAAEVLAAQGWQPLRFKSKEALALLNGTQFSTGWAVWALLRAQKIVEQANENAAAAMDGFNCRLEPLFEGIHRIRRQSGQISVAEHIRKLLKDSQIAQSEKTGVQDPYAFRCVPQVHGASVGALTHVREIIETELNAVTDNPNVFWEEDCIVSGGNFHAQPIALALDYLAIALAELGSISERRVYQLISGQRGLPPFLTPDAGLHSGFMIAQYTAAAIVSQNKMYAMPASTDSIVSCNGQEDHVSMAANAGVKAYKLVRNVERLLAIEFLVAMQALDYRLPLLSSGHIEQRRQAFREVVPTLQQDRMISEDMTKAEAFLFGVQA
jgi:histidine ammonia-lyase